MKSIIYELVEKGTTVVSDGWAGYKGLARYYIHEVIDHSSGQYVRTVFIPIQLKAFGYS